MPDKTDNNLSLFNEVMVSAYLYVLLQLTDFFGENLKREQSGFVLVGIVFLSVIINFGKFFYSVSKEIRSLLIKKGYMKKINEYFSKRVAKKEP